MAQAVRAELVMIGTELLLGQTVDTNAAHIAEKLADNGINVYFKATVGDNWTRMTAVLAQALTRADIVITSGGLGPTEDDLDPGSCGVGAAPGRWCKTGGALESIKSWFTRTGRHMPSSNRKQALCPKARTSSPTGRGRRRASSWRRTAKSSSACPACPTR